MRVEIFQFFIKRTSFVRAKRAADLEKVQGNITQVMLYIGEEYVIPLYTTYSQTILF